MKWDTTNNSELMISFFLKNNCMRHVSSEDQSPFLPILYSDIADAHAWVESEKKEKGSQFYNLTMASIKSENDIPMPKHMPRGKYIGDDVFSHIKMASIFRSSYTIDVLGKSVIIHVVFEKKGLSKKWKEPDIQKINAQIDNMIIWLHIANKYASKTCAPALEIFVYLTSLEKRIPDLDDISAIHVNTGVTTSCPLSNGEIIVYRHEEWFKVFIHESFHTLGLDFSDMSVKISETKLRDTFYIPTPILLFEAYTEFWARVLNVLIFSFRLTNDVDEFEKYATVFLDYERVNGFFQMVKVLQHMNIKYVDLHTDITLLERYHESTNVFVYYVITAILFNNYPLFIKWCGDNNDKLLQFKQTEDNQLLFCEYIQGHYNVADMEKCVNYANRLLTKTIMNSKKYPENKNIKIILETLRMSLCESCIK